MTLLASRWLTDTLLSLIFFSGSFRCVFFNFLAPSDRPPSLNRSTGTPLSLANASGCIPPRRVALAMPAAATAPSTPSRHEIWFGE